MLVYSSHWKHLVLKRPTLFWTVTKSVAIITNICYSVTLAYVHLWTLVPSVYVFSQRAACLTSYFHSKPS